MARLVQSVVPVTCRVEPQRRERSVLWDVVNNESFKTVRPDLLVTSGDGKACLPIDAKYKDYASESLGSSDLYQRAIYALAMARNRVPGQVPTCLMLYPVPRGGQLRQRVQVRLGGGALAEVDAHGIAVDDRLDPPATETPGLLWSGRVRELVASA